MSTAYNAVIKRLNILKFDGVDRRVIIMIFVHVSRSHFNMESWKTVEIIVLRHCK